MLATHNQHRLREFSIVSEIERGRELLSLQLGPTYDIITPLTLLSRIDGDAPAHKTISVGRVDGSRAGLCHITQPRSCEHRT